MLRQFLILGAVALLLTSLPAVVQAAITDSRQVVLSAWLHVRNGASLDDFVAKRLQGDAAGWFRSHPNVYASACQALGDCIMVFCIEKSQLGYRRVDFSIVTCDLQGRTEYGRRGYDRKFARPRIVSMRVHPWGQQDDAFRLTSSGVPAARQITWYMIVSNREMATMRADLKVQPASDRPAQVARVANVTNLPVRKTGAVAIPVEPEQDLARINAELGPTEAERSATYGVPISQAAPELQQLARQLLSAVKARSQRGVMRYAQTARARQWAEAILMPSRPELLDTANPAAIRIKTIGGNQYALVYPIVTDFRGGNQVVAFTIFLEVHGNVATLSPINWDGSRPKYVP